MQYLENFSVICLGETFLEYFDSLFFLPSFDKYIAPAVKLSERGRRSGGLLCLIRKNLRPYFHQIECKYDNFLAFRIDKVLFSSLNDVLTFFAYVPPTGSPYYATVNAPDGIHLLHQCISEVGCVHEDCSILLCGDLNARTSTLNTCDSNVFDVRSDFLENSRLSQDDSLNDNGHSLLSLCAAFDLCILNGCINKTDSNSFTFISPNGSSVIDYFIATRDLLPLCQSLLVRESVVSPHLCLELTFGNPDYTERYNCSVPRFCTKIVWDENSINEYVERLRDVLAEEGVQLAVSDEDYDVDSITGSITTCILRAADFLKKTIPCSGWFRCKEWYDKECCAAKKSARKSLREYLRHNTNEKRDVYIRHRNDYKLLTRQKKCEYRKICETLSNYVLDTQKFWKVIRRLKGGQCVTGTISLESWYSHFRDLFSSAGPISSVRVDLLLELPPDEPDNVFNAPITGDEISLALANLKGGKAAGPDLILGDMIRSAWHLLQPLLLQLFNRIFITGTFPRLWSQAIIHPVHKSGSYDSPDNYRGIALTSVLSKVFVHILNERLRGWMEEEGIYREEQAGFRRGYSTTDNIFVLHGIIQKYLIRKRKFSA